MPIGPMFDEEQLAIDKLLGNPIGHTFKQGRGLVRGAGRALLNLPADLVDLVGMLEGGQLPEAVSPVTAHWRKRVTDRLLAPEGTQSESVGEFFGPPSKLAAKGGAALAAVGGLPFKREVLERWLTPSHKNRERLIMMPPDDFLRMAAPLELGPDPDKLKNLADVLAQGKDLNNLPYLSLDTEGKIARVTGHEGRHRSIMFKERGIEQMPVVLGSPTLRWSEQTDPKSFDYRKVWPELLQGERRSDLMPFPLTRERAGLPDEALARLLIENPDERGLTGYSGRWMLTFKDGSKELFNFKPDDDVLKSMGATAQPSG